MKLLWKPTTDTFKFIVPYLDPSEGVQKVRGFSRGFHHNYSLRLGIKVHHGSNDYAFFLYGYAHGQRIEVAINTDNVKFEKGDIVECFLFATKGTFYARIRKYGQEVRAFSAAANFKAYKRLFPLGYKLYPYAEEDFTGAKKQLNIQFL